MDHQWHKTKSMLPPKDGNAVAGLWNAPDGTQYIALCYYDYESKKWQSAEVGDDNGDYLKTPDYWIEIPKPE
jgi:hypothetical protein